MRSGPPSGIPARSNTHPPHEPSATGIGVMRSRSVPVVDSNPERTAMTDRRLTCARKGCTRPAREGWRHCSAGCRTSSAELAAAHHVHAALGSSDISDEFLNAAEALDLAWSRLQRARRSVWQSAVDAGWTTEQAAGLLAGRVAVQKVGQEP